MKSNYSLLKKNLLLIFIYIFCSTQGLHAQTNSSSITGKVSDENGKALSGVTVTFKDGNATTITKED